MIDTAMKVHLIEINSSPAVAADLLPQFTKSLSIFVISVASSASYQIAISFIYPGKSLGG